MRTGPCLSHLLLKTQCLQQCLVHMCSIHICLLNKSLREVDRDNKYGEGYKKSYKGWAFLTPWLNWKKLSSLEPQMSHVYYLNGGAHQTSLLTSD